MVKASLIYCVMALWCVLSVNCATKTAPAPTQECATVILTMADCLSFVTSGSTVKKPEGGCCTGLKTVLKTAPDCLCQTFKSSGQLGIALDMQKAMTLPSACGVKAPPSIATCNLSVAPGASPAASPKSPKTPAPSSSSPSPSFAPGPASGTSTSTKSGASTMSVSFVALVSIVAVLCFHFLNIEFF